MSYLLQVQLANRLINNAKDSIADPNHVQLREEDEDDVYDNDSN